MFYEQLDENFEKYARKRSSLLLEGTCLDGYVLGFNDCESKFVKVLNNVLDKNQIENILEKFNLEVENVDVTKDMNINNWELKDSCDDTQFYYESKLNDDMIACIVIPHEGNNFRWLLRIGFKSTFNKWGDVEYENTFNTFPLLAEFMSNEKHLKEIELMKGE